MGQIKTAIIFFTDKGNKLANQIAPLFDAEIFSSPDKKTVQKLFLDGNAILGLCASGILIRMLAPILNDKQIEPPVIAISANGKQIVPLLGGHHGANKIADKLAKFLDGNSAITNASNMQFTHGLDEPPVGYILANPLLAKSAMLASINGARIALNGKANWLKQAGYILDKNGKVKISISEEIAKENILTYHPKTLIIGVGCERYLPTPELLHLINSTLEKNNLSPHSIAAIASINIKADEKAINEVAKYFNVPLRLFSAKNLQKEESRLPNISEIVRAEVGTPSVAEASAIKAGQLLVEKQKSKRATCAIGIAKTPIDIAKFGQARGSLHIVGIGPGEAEQRTMACIEALKQTSDWVGYSLYLNLISDLKINQIEHIFPLGDEEKRVRHALELAAKGKSVALVCSGDAQIYAMASLVFELLNASGKRELSKNAKLVEIISHPGISALQMASSRVGALLGHDFCAISLSDLLTPKQAILERLEAAAKADFVTAFYNPRSKTRYDLLDKAKEIFLKHRPPSTPVIIARSLGRVDEEVRVVTLSDFKTSEVDMMTIVLFGSSNSISFMQGDGQKVAFTPRGYDKKIFTPNTTNEKQGTK
jgi:cobalt-precorrin 5A hydrolase/precorrin-3B C17-methyltransferase